MKSKSIFELRFSIYDFIRIGLGILFIVASYYKILSPGAFAHQIYNYKILSGWAINPLAMVLPWVQFFCGLALLFNKGIRGASLLIVLMMFAFQLALASALWRGLNISCGCFKSGGEAATWWTFGRDFLLFALALLQCWNAFRLLSPKFSIWDPFKHWN